MVDWSSIDTYRNRHWQITERFALVLLYHYTMISLHAEDTFWAPDMLQVLSAKKLKEHDINVFLTYPNSRPSYKLVHSWTRLVLSFLLSDAGLVRQWTHYSLKVTVLSVCRLLCRDFLQGPLAARRQLTHACSLAMARMCLAATCRHRQRSCHIVASQALFRRSSKHPARNPNWTHGEHPHQIP